MNSSLIRLYFVLGTFGWKDIVRGSINAKVEVIQRVGYLLVGDGFVEISQFWTFGDGAQTGWELANLCGVVILLNMLATTSYRDSIKHLEKVEREHVEQLLCSPFVGVFDS